jgi:hypothetical protein
MYPTERDNGSTGQEMGKNGISTHVREPFTDRCHYPFIEMKKPLFSIQSKEKLSFFIIVLSKAIRLRIIPYPYPSKKMHTHP